MGHFLLAADSLDLLEVGMVPICQLDLTKVQREQCRSDMSVT